MESIGASPHGAQAPSEGSVVALNRAHWDATLDPQNLRGSATPLSVERQLALALTADVRRALAALAPLRDQATLDFGGGLGLHAVHLARRGAIVVLADVSLPRLRQALALAESLGLRDRIVAVQCAGEALPFATDALDRAFCKSTLIHTDLPCAAAELARVLSPRGRAVLIEPTVANPLVNLYRALAAPRIWQVITKYFTPASEATLRAAFRRRGHRTTTERLYLLAFLATAFNFALPSPALYRAAERVLLALDSVLFTLLPPLRRRAWFHLLKVGPRR